MINTCVLLDDKNNMNDMNDANDTNYRFKRG